MSDVSLPIRSQHVDHLSTRVGRFRHKVGEHPHQRVLILKKQDGPRSSLKSNNTLGSSACGGQVLVAAHEIPARCSLCPSSHRPRRLRCPWWAWRNKARMREKRWADYLVIKRQFNSPLNPRSSSCVSNSCWLKQSAPPHLLKKTPVNQSQPGLELRSLVGHCSL